jgi:hypothetical protein
MGPAELSKIRDAAKLLGWSVCQEAVKKAIQVIQISFVPDKSRNSDLGYSIHTYFTLHFFNIPVILD